MLLSLSGGVVVAWFGLVTAHERGETIRDDIAYDAEGNCTTSPGDALKGALRVFDRSYVYSNCD